jgi:molybdate transport system substrate-binding protein
VIQPRELLLLVLGLSATAGADDSLTIAVASNFRSTARIIADAFTNELGVSVRLSSGSTGKLYAQIVNGAPYDVFLAADMQRPRLLETSGDAIAGSLQLYADGKLVLISADPSLKGQYCSRVLRSGSYKKLAIANPATAPYGAAAKAYLLAEGLWDDAMPRIIMGENISQTFQFVATKNATLGIVAASQLAHENSPTEITCRRAIDVPTTHVVHQGGVILRRTNNLDDARLFMKYLGSETARDLMISYGYEVPTN